MTDPPQDIQKKGEQDNDDYEIQKNGRYSEPQVNPQLPPGEDLKEIEELEKKELNQSLGTPQKEQIEKQEFEDDFDFGEFKAVEVLNENPEQKSLEQNEEDKQKIIEPKDEIEKYYAIEQKFSETPIIDQEKLSNIHKNETKEYFSESYQDSTQHKPPINYDASAKNEIKGMEEMFFEESKNIQHNLDQQEEAFKAKKSKADASENEDLYGNFTNEVKANYPTENLKKNQINEDPIYYSIPPSNEQSNKVETAIKVDDLAELNNPQIQQNRGVENNAQINPSEKALEFDPKKAKNENEKEKNYNFPKEEEAAEDEFEDFKINSNSGQEQHKIVEETKENHEVSKAISNKNQENGGKDEDELDFGDFNFNTVTKTAQENIQTSEPQAQSEGNDLFGKSKIEPDLFGSDNSQQPQTFNFSSNFSLSGFSTNFSSSNFGNFNFNQTAVEQKKELVIEKEKKDESDDDMFGEDKTKLKKSPESPLFGEEEEKIALEEKSAKKVKKTDFVNIPSFLKK